MQETAQEAPGEVQAGRNDVFISYAREDQDFVRRLHDALAEKGRSSWVDWEGIPPTAEWMGEVKGAIEAADSFVFVVSPASVASRVCKEEAEHAAAQKKRIVPLVRKDVEGQVPTPVAAHNWIFFRDTDDFEASTETLLRALDTDLEWVKAHTRLLVRAREWEEGGKDRSLLVRGKDLEAAERWLGEAGAHKEPTPTPLHTEYVLASRRAATRRQRTGIAAIAVALVVALVLSAVAVVQRNQAQDARDEANRNARESRSRELAAASIGQLELDPELSILLAKEALRIGRTTQAEEALRRAVGASHVRLALNGHEERVFDVAISPDGSAAITGSADRTVRIWDLKSGDLVRVLEGHRAAVTHVEVDTSGESVLSVDRRGQSIVWELATGAERARFRGDAAVFSPDGRFVATVTLGGASAVFRAEDGVEIGRFHWTGPRRGGSTVAGRTAVAVRFDPAGRWVLGVTGRSAWVWDITTERLLGSSIGTSPVYAVALSPDGDLAALGHGDGQVDVWKPGSGRDISAVRSPEAGHIVLDLEFSTDGQLLLPKQLLVREPRSPRDGDLPCGRDLGTSRQHPRS